MCEIGKKMMRKKNNRERLLPFTFINGKHGTDGEIGKSMKSTGNTCI